ncbi:putative translation initiation factor eIF-2B subunit beta [Golovinomyces cichoracearum]|uniref:Translation initiation factor eIF2B subunit beta n=1 Tax=Golovinomyces cichoracearum TaxID=62708 RepID=A0A420H717_9PEZI|nr:putative translation initiation factor eIF-2B subunit beta [Golovinomyces cichoracearum]
MMPLLKNSQAPDLTTFLKSLKITGAQSSIENLISLLKRRQLRSSRACAIATAHLLLRVVARFKWTDVGKLLDRIADIGQRLVEAQPREMVVGNIVRRIVDMIKDEAREDHLEVGSDSTSQSQMESPRMAPSEYLPSKTNLATSSCVIPRLGQPGTIELSETCCDDAIHTQLQGPSKLSRVVANSHISYAVSSGTAMPQTMFNLLSTTNSPYVTPPGNFSPLKSVVSAASLARRIATTTKDLKAEIISGIEEIIDELDQVNDQIAAYAQEHIHSNEIILTHSISLSVQKFLLKAAEKRKFTIIITESYPNEHNNVHSIVTGKSDNFPNEDEDMDVKSFMKHLSAAGVTVILITDASIFAIMSRVNKVILATHAVIANGGLIADAGARIIAKAAKVHKTPVIVVSGVYKLSPEYPYEIESLIEYGDPGRVIPFDNGVLAEELEVDNPVYDYVPPDLVDLYITNLGAHAPSYLYRIVAEHYKTDDFDLNKPELHL